MDSLIVALGNIIDWMATAVLLTIIVLAVKQLSHSFCVNIKTSVLILFYKLIFMILYIIYSFDAKNDAYSYYYDYIENVNNWYLGTGFIIEFTQALRKYFYLSYFNVSLIYTFVSVVAFIVLISTFNQLYGRHGIVSKFLCSILFFPSFNLWTSGIGKDSIIVLGLSILLYCIMLKKNNVLLIIVALLLIGAARPSQLAIVCVSLLTYQIIFFKSPRANSLVYFMGGTFGCLLACVVLFRYVGFDGIPSFQSVIDYINYRSSLNTSGRLSYFNQFHNINFRYIAYVIRPNIIDVFNANEFGLVYFAWVLEGTAITAFTIYCIFCAFQRKQVLVSSGHFFCLLYSVVGLVLLASVTSNIGISVRQKWMILPFMFVFIGAFGHRRPFIETRQ